MSGSVPATRGAATRRPLDILLWGVQAFLAFVFVGAAWAKLTGNPQMLALFSAVGFLILGFGSATYDKARITA